MSRKLDVKTRAQILDQEYRHCRVLGCKNPARAATDDGVDKRFCRSHYEHYQRHGSPFKGSYTAKELNPYRQAALCWLLDNPEDSWGLQAVGRVKGLYRRAGPHVEAFRLRGMKPRERAWAHWARLRLHEVDAKLPVAAWLAMEMILLDDLTAEWRDEYKVVQTAKLVHRMASGSHRKWVQQYSFGTYVKELHVYPRPRGRVLRYIGEDLSKACELFVEYRLGSVFDLKRSREKQGSFSSSPYPRGWSARRRS